MLVCVLPDTPATINNHAVNDLTKPNKTQHLVIVYGIRSLETNISKFFDNYLRLEHRIFSEIFNRLSWQVENLAKQIM